MILHALTATLYDLLVGLGLALLALLFIAALVRSGLNQKRREQERCQVHEKQEFIPAFSQWPKRPRPATAEAHPRAHEAVVPSAGRRAA